MNSIEIEDPIEGIDFGIEEMRRYTISIEVNFDFLGEVDEVVDIKQNAIIAFREGSIDGSATIVHSELISKVELDLNTGMAFNREVWQTKKLFELGLNAKGDPLRPHEKIRPKGERKICDFLEGDEVPL